MAREQAFLATPFLSPSTRIIASPFQFATDENTNVRIVSANSLAGVVLAIQGRRLNAKGEIEPFAFTHTPNTDRSTRTQDYKLGAGALLNLVIFASSGAPLIGQTYVMAHLILGLTGATLMLGQLLGGYVTAAQPLAYPGSPIQSSIEGGGVARAFLGTDPAAGAEVLETVPTGARWHVHTMLVSIIPSATAANRRPKLVIDDGANVMIEVPSIRATPASSIEMHVWAVGMPLDTQQVTSRAIMGLPSGLQLLAGSRIKTETASMQADDNYVAPNLAITEWLEVSS